MLQARRCSVVRGGGGGVAALFGVCQAGTTTGATTGAFGGLPRGFFSGGAPLYSDTDGGAPLAFDTTVLGGSSGC